MRICHFLVEKDLTYRPEGRLPLPGFEDAAGIAKPVYLPNVRAHGGNPQPEPEPSMSWLEVQLDM